MAQVSVDMSGELFDARVSIAHLAAFGFDDVESDRLTIYEAAKRIESDWRWELMEDGLELEYLTGICATFKDGSKLNVSAWAGCCDTGRCRICSGAN